EHRVLHVLQPVTVARRLVVQRDGPRPEHCRELDPGDEGSAFRAVAAAAVQAGSAGQPGEEVCHPGHGSEAAPLRRPRCVRYPRRIHANEWNFGWPGWWGLARTS